MTEKSGATFYETLSTKETGGNYEKKRWESPLGRVHFESTKRVVLTEAVSRAKGAKSFAEVGPGPGTWTAFFLSAFPSASFTLIDISEEMLGEARRALPPDRAISFVHTDLLKYQPTSSVDFFFSSRAIEYIEDKPAALKKITLMLTKEGRGFIITKCAHPWRDALRGRALPERHKHQTTPRAFIGLLKSEGFKIEAWGVAAVTIPLTQNPTLTRIATRVLFSLPSFLIPRFLLESFWVSFRKV